MVTKENTSPSFGSGLAEHRNNSEEAGQSLTEFVVVAAFALVPLFFLVVYTGKWSFSQLRTIEAARYVAWERTVWREQAPQEREWTAIKGDGELRNEAALRFFGDPSTLPLIPVTAAMASSGGVDPLLTRHDGRPLLQNLGLVQANTRVESMPAGFSTTFMTTLAKIVNIPLDMENGPTVATVGVQLEGLPGFGHLPGNPLAKGLRFTAQAAVLTDAWAVNGPAEEARIVQKFLPSQLMNNTAINAVKSAGGWLFPELNRLDFGHIDPEVQYGDRLQPYPKE